MSENDGPRSILIVEDAFLVGMQLKEDLESLGYSVVGPAKLSAKSHLPHRTPLNSWCSFRR